MRQSNNDINPTSWAILDTTLVSETTTSTVVDDTMHIKAKLHTVRLDKRLYDPALLQDEIALENALCILEGHLRSAAASQEALLRDLASVPNLFEFALSAAGVGDEVAALSVENIVALFPTNAASFEASFVGSLLLQLSRYFWLLDIQLDSVKECHRSVGLARSALKALSAMTFETEVRSPVEDVPEEFEGMFVVKRSKQKDRKKAKKAIRTISIDTKPFDQLGVQIPNSRGAALTLEQELLEDQKRVLRHYLEVLRMPDYVNNFRKAYIKEATIVDNLAENDEAGQIDNITDGAAPAASIPSAFPHVQPIKAAFYFDSVQGFGDWRILISTRADRNLREAKRSDQTYFRIILKKIKELSNGHFSDDNQKRLTGANNDVPIYEAKMTRDSRLVYQVDCIKDFEADIERQVIRVYGVFTHAQLDSHLWDAMSQHLGRKGKEYKKRCIYRTKPVVAGDKVFAPATFPPTNEVSSPVTPTKIPELRAEDQQELHSLLVLEKFVTFSQALLNSIIADQDVAHVFHMSPAEQDIVKHTGSCFVLGRSGTGKTTTMLFKMLGIEKACEHLSKAYEEELPHPRQLFVTQSRVLAEKVEEYYAKLAASHAAAQRTAAESAQLAVEQQAKEDRGLVDRDEEEFWRGNLPKAFSELKDEHFPLFVTFDHLCRLLEGDLKKSMAKLGLGLDTADEIEATDNATTASDYMLQRRASFVSYGTFLQEYWPHLPQPLTKNLDPALIFAEFMGVIRGSEQSIASETGYLDKDQYLAISHRQQGTFASRRDAVYALFLVYLKKKREMRHWDAADRTHGILEGLRSSGVPGSKLDFVYVDEAQDNLLIDALVLRKICKNPDGLFWAGDTAQTISVGSSFRFDDLKAFLYRLESSYATAVVKPQHAFQLTMNYRSHGGIVNCAHSVVQLITRFWPHAIDSLAEERGIVDGLRPIFFSGWDQDSVQYEQFLFGASGEQIEFGAQQCILVRDDAARERLREQVGDIGLVLTLYESKGLEFNDVLLYNFFEDSTVDVGQWRVVLNALPPRKNLKCPTFDDTRHSGVCRELKFLYVAITRARQNLWIADCSEKGEPLRTYWNSKDLVHNVSAVDQVPRLATTSTATEWAATARTLFDNKRYSQAARSYERAGMLRERDIAEAYFLRECARSKPVSRSTVDNPRKLAFTQAATAFATSASSASLRSEKLAYYRNCAECYIEAGELTKAARTYILAEEYTRSVKLFREDGKFDDAVDTIQRYRARIQPAEAEKIEKVAKLYYFQQQDLDRATRLFPDLDKALEFMEDYGFNVARYTLLEQYGRLTEAAEIHLEEGRTSQAIRLFMKDSDESSHHRAESSLLQGLWQQISFGSSIGSDGNVARSYLGELLALSEELRDQFTLTPQTVDQVTMFQAIVDGASLQLQTLAARFLSAYDDSAAAILCLEYAFRQSLKVQAAAGDVVVFKLQAFYTYTREMQKLLAEPDPAQSISIQKLFGFSLVPDSENTFILSKGTFLHTEMVRLGRVPTTQADDANDLMVTLWDITSVLDISLRERLRRKIHDENFECSRAIAFRLCPALVVLGTCNSTARCGAGHDASLANREAFHSRVRMILQQILIYQATSPLESRLEVEKQRRFWLSRLYQAYYPVHGKLGSSIDLDLTLIPEADKGLQVVKEWIKDFFFTATSGGHNAQHFLSDITETATLALAIEKGGAIAYFHRAPCITREKRRDLMRKGGRYVVHDFLDFVCRTTETALSAGVLFIKAIFEMQLDMDANIICQMVEQLCAAFIVAYRLQKRDSLHDLTLSRKWVIRLHAAESMKNQKTNLLQLFIDLIPELLWGMYTGFKFLHYDREYRTDYQIRNIFVSRICKNFTLLGYNIPDLKLRQDIYNNLTSLKRKDRQTDTRYPRVFQRYVNASSWPDLIRALRNTGVDELGSSDEQIHLRDSAKVVGEPYEIRGTRSIVYKRVIDIPALLRGEKVFVSDLRADAPTFVPTRVTQPVDNDTVDAAEERELGLSAPPDEEDSGIDHGVDLEAAAQAVDEGREEQIVVPPSAEEIAAATFFTRAYRRRLSRRKGVPKKGMEAERNRWYIAFRDSPLTKSFTSKEYEVIFLGPLPLALVCLDVMNGHVLASKKKARMRKDLVKHSEYENIMTQIDRAISFNKRIQAVKEKLKPGSQFHLQQSLVALKRLVTEVSNIAAELPEGMTQGIGWDLETALKGIVQERKPRKVKEEKPTLAIDIDDFEYYE